MGSTNDALKQGIVAFALADLDGATLVPDVDAAAAQQAARLGEIVDQACVRWDGERVVEPAETDCAVIVFARASSALAAAVDIAHAARSGSLDGPDVSLARVAVHAGEIDADANGDADAHRPGPAVERGRRILRAGHGGQVLASSAVVDLGRAGLGATCRLIDLGPHVLPGDDAPVGIVQVVPAGCRESFPPLRTVSVAAPALPHPDSSLVGRADDLAALAALVDNHRVVTVVGAGGCGKTRLAVELAHETIGRFRDGVAWVDLSPLTGVEAVLDATAVAVGLRTSAGVTSDLVASHLANRSILLLIDNCEHVIEPVAELIATIEGRCPGVRVVATSREPLALRDEVVWRVPSLTLPTDPDGADLMESGAGRLIVERIRRTRPDFRCDDADARALAAVTRRLDGIPLALELAAARTATIAPRELAGRLDERFALLAGGSRDAVARQRTIEASVAWSYQLLDPAEQHVFRWLSTFAGSFTAVSAGALLDGRPGVGDIVERLVACSLLVENGQSPRRLRMLEPVRWFARERLIDLGEANHALGRHLDRCIATVGQLGPALDGPDALAALAQLDLELDDLRAAMDWALAHDRGVDVARIIAISPWFWIWRGRSLEARRWLHRAGPDVDTALRAGDQLGLFWARAALALNNAAPEANEIIDAGVSLALSMGDRAAEARFQVLFSLARAFHDPDGVIAEAAGLRERCSEAGDAFWAATSLVAESLAHITLGRFDLAEPLLDQLRLEAEALGHPQLLADEISRRVIVDRRFGRYDEVHRALNRIAEVTEHLTETNAQALVHAQAALVDVSQGRASAALDAMEALMDRYVEAGEYGYIPSIALPIIDALLDLDRADEAVERFEPFWEPWRVSISWRLRMGNTRAIALYASGRTDQAQAAFTDVVTEARVAGNDHEVANAERFLGAIARQAQRFGEAEELFHRALDIQAGLGYPQYVADVLEELAGVELDHDRPTASATLFGAASTIRQTSGVVRRIGRQDAYDTDISRIHDLADESLADAWNRGARLTMDDAVELARRGRGERRRPTIGWESLTVTEAKVAALVAEGRTNPEIAEALIMGRATVKTHVSNILRKLDLTNRTQIAATSPRR